MKGPSLSLWISRYKWYLFYFETESRFSCEKCLSLNFHWFPFSWWTLLERGSNFSSSPGFLSNLFLETSLNHIFSLHLFWVLPCQLPLLNSFWFAKTAFQLIKDQHCSLFCYQIVPGILFNPCAWYNFRLCWWSSHHFSLQ